MIRRILVDAARARASEKRLGGDPRLTFNEDLPVAVGPDINVMDLDDALESLAKLDARKARVVFSRQCLGSRRIPDLKSLRREAKAWNRRMNLDRIKINWKFDRTAARRKFDYKRQAFIRSKT